MKRRDAIDVLIIGDEESLGVGVAQAACETRGFGSLRVGSAEEAIALLVEGDMRVDLLIIANPALAMGPSQIVTEVRGRARCAFVPMLVQLCPRQEASARAEVVEGCGDQDFVDFFCASDGPRMLQARVSNAIALHRTQHTADQCRREEKRDRQVSRHAMLRVAFSVFMRFANESRNVLMCVNNALDEFEGKLPASCEHDDFFEVVRSSTHRLLERFKDVEILVSEEAAREPVNAEETLDRLMLAIIPTLPDSILVRVRYTESPWWVMVDKDLYEIAITHAVRNAVEAMPEGGELWIDCFNARVAGADGELEEFVKVEISDTGEGIASELYDTVFEPFYSTKDRSTHPGLGLSRVESIMSQLRGFVDIGRGPAGGASLALLAPRAREHDASPQGVAPPRLAPGPRRALTFLLVDDEVELLSMLTTQLQRQGHRVLTCTDGVSAIETYRRHAATIDLVILDVNLHDLSGVDVHQALVQLEPGVRIILDTGFASMGDVYAMADRERTMVLRKPHHVSELTAMVDEIMGIL